MENCVALVLAAGFGKRLQPATLVRPKPLIPVAGVEPLFYSLYRLQNSGIKNVFVNIHYKGEQIVEALSEWKDLLPNLEIKILDERDKILGTGGSILKLLREEQSVLSSRGLLVQNSDTISNLQLNELINSKYSAFALSSNEEFLKRYFPIWIDSDSRYVGVGANPPGVTCSPRHFLGSHFINYSSLLELNRLKLELSEIDLFNGVYRPLISKGQVFKGIDLLDSNNEQFWFDMTNKEFLLEAQKKLFSDYLHKEWSSVLQARYPGIKKIGKNIFLRCCDRDVKNISQHNLEGPAVIVGDGPVLSSKHSFGPNLTWVSSCGRKSTEGITEARNSVIVCSEKRSLKLREQYLNDLVVF